MPRSLDPDALVEIVLQTDKGKPNPPTFLFKVLSVRDEERLGQIYDFEKDAENSLSTRVQEYLQPLLRGWKNMGRWDFGEHKLIDVVDTAEAFDLASQLLASGRLAYEEKKRSESQALSAEESSASHAAKSVGNASTD